MLIGLLVLILKRIYLLIRAYLSNCLLGIYVLLIEHKNIKKLTFKKAIIAILTWPTFDSIGRYATYIALFKKVEWVPTPHRSKITIDDLKK